MDFIQKLKEKRVIAIVRGVDTEEALFVTDALLKGGVDLIEIALNTPHAVETISRLTLEFGSDLFIGAGTVLNTELAVSAHEAGARYFLTPSLVPEVLTYAQKNDLVCIPGAFTPTEINTANALGAKVIKVFPIRSLGPAYIRDVLSSMDAINLIAVGGVTVDNAHLFIKAGAIGVGIGSGLVSSNLIKDYSALQVLAKRLIQNVSQ